MIPEEENMMTLRLGVGILMIFVTYQPSDIGSEACTTEVSLLALLLICLLSLVVLGYSPPRGFEGLGT